LPAGEAVELPPLLRHAALVTLTIPSGSAAAGKIISEIQLRSSTGASIVGIERDNENIINPSAFEEVRAGDAILLLGNEKQILAARKLLE
jgi:CPA2 family monovalent cation:H+ antiporter-2